MTPPDAEQKPRLEELSNADYIRLWKTNIRGTGCDAHNVRLEKIAAGLTGKQTTAEKMTERRVEAIARARYERCFNSFGDTTWQGLADDQRNAWIIGAKKDITADPATALLAEAVEVIKVVLDGLNARIDAAARSHTTVPVFDGISDLHRLLVRIDNSGGDL